MEHFSRRQFLRRATFGSVGVLTNGTSTVSHPTAEAYRSDSDEWTKKLGRLRTVFDVWDFTPFPGLGSIPRVMDGYNQEVGVPDRELGIVVVIRGRAVAMLLNPALWRNFHIADDILQLSLLDVAHSGNPFFRAIENFQRRGVVVLGCRAALIELASEISRKRGLNQTEVRGMVGNSLLPGVTLVHNGVFALARAQNVGCGLINTGN